MQNTTSDARGMWNFELQFQTLPDKIVDNNYQYLTSDTKKCYIIMYAYYSDPLPLFQC